MNIQYTYVEYSTVYYFFGILTINFLTYLNKTAFYSKIKYKFSLFAGEFESIGTFGAKAILYGN